MYERLGGHWPEETSPLDHVRTDPPRHAQSEQAGTKGQSRKTTPIYVRCRHYTSNWSSWLERVCFFVICDVNCLTFAFLYTSQSRLSCLIRTFAEKIKPFYLKNRQVNAFTWCILVIVIRLLSITWVIWSIIMKSIYKSRGFLRGVVSCQSALSWWIPLNSNVHRTNPTPRSTKVKARDSFWSMNSRSL